MSRIACVWADLGASSETCEWYEDEHIPDVVATLKTKAHHAEQAEENMFKEVPGIQGNLMTVYELPDTADVEGVKLHPALDKLSANARLETRSYKEHANWFGKEWRGDPSDVQMWIVVLWQPVEALHEEFVSWFREEFTPGMLSAPELLRIRIFELESASVVQDHKHEQQDTRSTYQYLTLWEHNCDELPWETLVYLGSSERWRFYVEGGHLNWQIGQYLVHRVYPDDEITKKPATRPVSTVINEGLKRPINEFLEDEFDTEENKEGDVRVVSVDDTIGIGERSLERKHLDNLQETVGLAHGN